MSSRLWGPAERGGRRAAAAAVSNLLLRIVSAPLPAVLSEPPRAMARLDPRPRRRTGHGPPAPHPSAHPGPRPHPPLTWAAAARGCAHSGCELGARRCSRGRRRPRRRCRAAVGAQGPWRGRPGRGQGRATKGWETVRRLSCQRRAPAQPQAGRDPHRPRPLCSAPSGSDPSQGAPSAPTTSPPPAPALGARPLPAPSRAPPQTRHRPSPGPAQRMCSPPIITPLLAQRPGPARSTSKAPPPVLRLHPSGSSAQNALSLATLTPPRLQRPRQC